MNDLRVAILVGSDSDLPVMAEAAKTLETFGVPHEIRVRSAHRSPGETSEYIRDAEARGARVFICAAGMAAHLAGAVAGHTRRPVIGVPMESGALAGIDALLSTVQMPPGVPVMTVAIGKAGATNAALGAIQILALSDEELDRRLVEYKEQMREKTLSKDAELQEKGIQGYA